MRADDCVDDRQPEAHAAAAAVARRVGPGEAREDPIELLGRDPRAAVAYVDRDDPVEGPRARSARDERERPRLVLDDEDPVSLDIATNLTRVRRSWKMTPG